MLTNLSAIISLVVSVTLILFTDRFGRRLVVFGAAICCTATLLLVGILGQVEKTASLKNFLIFVACLWSAGSSARKCFQ
jgi:hypothetical protein